MAGRDPVFNSLEIRILEIRKDAQKVREAKRRIEKPSLLKGRIVGPNSRSRKKGMGCHVLGYVPKYLTVLPMGRRGVFKFVETGNAYLSQRENARHAPGRRTADR